MAAVELAKDLNRDLNSLSLPTPVNQDRLDKLQELFKQAAPGSKGITINFGSGDETDRLDIRKDGKGGFNFSRIQFSRDSEHCTTNDYHINANGIVTAGSETRKYTSSEPGETDKIPISQAGKSVDSLIKQFFSKLEEKKK